MTGLYYYPYSRVYLRTHVARISRGFVVVGLAALSAGIIVLAAIGFLQVLT